MIKKKNDILTFEQYNNELREKSQGFIPNTNIHFSPPQEFGIALPPNHTSIIFNDLFAVITLSKRL